MKNEESNLVALRITNGALKGEGLPKSLQLLKWGENPSVKGPICVSANTLAAMRAGQEALGFGRVAIDFEHNTVPGSPEFERSQEPRRVAGYGTPVVIEPGGKGETEKGGDGETVPGGLFLQDIEWTPAGMAEARNFADLSPAVRLTEKGEVAFLHSVALTRNGAVHDLSFFNADHAETRRRGEDGSQKGTKQNKNMSEKMAGVVLLAAMAGALGLGAEASEDQVMKRITRLNSLEDELKKLGDKIAGLSTFKVPDDLVNRITALETANKDRATQQESIERGQLIARFSAEGKVPKGTDGKELSNEQLTALSADSLKLLLANTPATVPLSARGQRTEVRGQAGGGDVTGWRRAGRAWAHLQN